MNIRLKDLAMVGKWISWSRAWRAGHTHRKWAIISSKGRSIGGIDENTGCCSGVVVRCSWSSTCTRKTISPWLICARVKVIVIGSTSEVIDIAAIVWIVLMRRIWI